MQYIKIILKEILLSY